MSIFEIVMLVCFGAAWPFSIYKSWRTREVRGKSPLFLVVVLPGYASGVLHKFTYHYDWVVFLYMLNEAMVSADIALSVRNRLYHTRRSLAEAARDRVRGE